MISDLIFFAKKEGDGVDLVIPIKVYLVKPRILFCWDHLSECLREFGFLTFGNGAPGKAWNFKPSIVYYFIYIYCDKSNQIGSRPSRKYCRGVVTRVAFGYAQFPANSYANVWCLRRSKTRGTTDKNARKGWLYEIVCGDGWKKENN